MSEWLSSDDAFSEEGDEDRGGASPRELDHHRRALMHSGSPTPMDPLPGLSDEASPLAAWINSTENDASLALPLDDYIHGGFLKQRRARVTTF